VKEERLVVPDQEMIELQVELRRINGNSEQVGCDLINPGHLTPPEAIPFSAF